ncbi:MAG: hypothetical protein R6X08_08620 [Desulfosalsimonadaceae bacterium]
MVRPFTREDIENNPCRVLSGGRWGNADLYLYRQQGNEWVIKDFSPCPPLVRQVWGRFLVRREYRALYRLRGISGIPTDPFILDDYALCYRYIPGCILREVSTKVLNSDFFFRLEVLVQQMHERRMVHLDIRNSRNVLVTENGRPALLDFQSCLCLDRVPKGLHLLLKEVDISGVYKLWQRKQPQTLDAGRRARLAAINRRRRFWVLRGYPLGMRKARRRYGEK